MLTKLVILFLSTFRVLDNSKMCLQFHADKVVLKFFFIENDEEDIIVMANYKLPPILR